ncbi:uncharacterized protein LOC121393525 isoform X1 [Xenopus laevis]|uniref:Uncharacterized protein LOC121393525 isoform X1 n=2 Tax=Xenopus laevis TaxID=8355 RepID=A0A8J1KLT9_XENLA|nr:uncharacterized protein LOC121393525 isoform X1 [Xenopus laevis]
MRYFCDFTDGRPTNFKNKENDLPPEAPEKASMVQGLQDKMKKLIHTVKGKFRKEIPVPDTTDVSATPVTDSPGLLQKGKAKLQQIAAKGESAKKKITDMISDLKNINGANAKKKLADMMSGIENSKDSKIQEIKDTMTKLLNTIKNKFSKGEINTDQPVEDMLTEAFENLAKQRIISTKIVCSLILICVGIIVCVAVYRICHRKM